MKPPPVFCFYFCLFESPTATMLPSLLWIFLQLLLHRSISLSSMSPDGFLLFLSSTCPSPCLCFFQQCPEVRGTYYLCVDSLQPSQILISFSSLLLWGHAAEESKGLSVHRHRHTYMETQTLTFLAGTNRASKTYLIYILGYFYFYFVKPL